jgi:glycerol-3-phosphate acyltransferase PlsX
LNILVDAMGGDRAPKEIVRGAIDSLRKSKDKELIVTLLGDEERIEDVISRIKLPNKKHYDKLRLKIIHTDEVIDNNDVPTKAIKEKKNSSMVIGFEMLKKGNGDVFLSAGSTGALLTGALLKLGRIKGVDRPALAPIIPTRNGGTMLIDAGLSTNCKPLNYLQHGIMGSLYMEQVFNIKKPAIGLINIGKEEKKGNETLKQAKQMLEKTSLNFIGYIEGNDIPEGKVKVAICDGFTGNVLLKFLEGVGTFVFGGLRRVFKKNIFSKIAALLVKRDLTVFKNSFDYEEYGGTPLLGINGIVFKCHGSSKAKSIRNTIIKANDYAKNKVNDLIKEKLNGMEDI